MFSLFVASFIFSLSLSIYLSLSLSPPLSLSPSLSLSLSLFPLSLSISPCPSPSLSPYLSFSLSLYLSLSPICQSISPISLSLSFPFPLSCSNLTLLMSSESRATLARKSIISLLSSSCILGVTSRNSAVAHNCSCHHSSGPFIMVFLRQKEPGRIFLTFDSCIPQCRATITWKPLIQAFGGWNFQPLCGGCK